MLKISPSILASDFANLEAEAHKMEQAGADLLHIDVMDGHFVPNLTLGAPIVKCLRKKTTLPFDVHLMISDPYRYLEDFVRADLITFHLEADSDVGQTIAAIKKAGLKAGISLKPGTSAEAVFPYLKDLDMLLVMTVEPGFGGQKFMADMLPKITAIRRQADLVQPQLDIEVDGGIDNNTVPLVKKAGANVFVAGSALFGAEDPVKAVQTLRNTAENA